MTENSQLRLPHIDQIQVRTAFEILNRLSNIGFIHIPVDLASIVLSVQTSFLHITAPDIYLAEICVCSSFQLKDCFFWEETTR